MPTRDRAAYMRAYRARKRAARHPPATPVPKAASDPAAAVAAWATATLQVPAGLLRGQPFALADWQVDWLRGALALGIREAGLSVARKNGKALALTTPLPTPTGWRTMADIAAGDQVCGVDGQPCTVLAISAVMHDRPCYRVTFSDGSRIVADADHQWVTRHTYRPWAPAPRYPSQAETVTTAQIAASVLRPRTDGTREHNHHIDVPPALEMCGTQVLPVSPYVLGVWLGDGYLKTCLGHPVLGQPLILRNAFGTSIPEIDPDDLGTVPVSRVGQRLEGRYRGEDGGCKHLERESQKARRRCGCQAGEAP